MLTIRLDNTDLLKEREENPEDFLKGKTVLIDFMSDRYLVHDGENIASVFGEDHMDAWDLLRNVAFGLCGDDGVHYIDVDLDEDDEWNDAFLRSWNWDDILNFVCNDVQPEVDLDA